MITPEAQKYIADSRASGMSDDQIRAALAQQGWGADDINSGLSQPGSVPPAAATPMPHQPFPTWAKILIGVLAAGIFVSVALAIAGRALISNMGNKIEENTGFNLPQNPEKPSVTCGTWPETEAERIQYAYLFQAETTLPSVFPKGWAYPQGAYIGTYWHTEDDAAKFNDSRNLGFFFFCTKDSVQTVFDYYKNLKLSNWTVTEADYLPQQQADEYTMGGQTIRAETARVNNSYYLLGITMFPKGDRTLIFVDYGVNDINEAD